MDLHEFEQNTGLKKKFITFELQRKIILIYYFYRCNKELSLQFGPLFLACIYYFKGETFQIHVYP